MRLNSCEVAKLLLLKIRFRQFLFNCGDSVKIYYDSTVKWLCDSSITPKQRGKKVAPSELWAPSLFTSQPPYYLHPLFILSRLMRPPTRCCCRSSSSPPRACALRERARGSWSGLHASERCLGLILGYSWRESKRERDRERGQGHYIMLTLFSRCLNIMKADHKKLCGNKSAA